jgi:hypothetical protein
VLYIAKEKLTQSLDLVLSKYEAVETVSDNDGILSYTQQTVSDLDIIYLSCSLFSKLVHLSRYIWDYSNRFRLRPIAVYSLNKHLLLSTGCCFSDHTAWRYAESTRCEKNFTLQDIWMHRILTGVMHNLNYVIFEIVGRDSSAGIATRYEVDGPGIEFPWIQYFSQPPRAGLGCTQPTLQRVPGHFLG